VAKGQSSNSIYYISTSTPYPLQNLSKDLRHELENKLKEIQSLNEEEKNKLRIDEKNLNNINSSDLIIAGKNKVHRLLYNEISNEFRFSFWGNIKDNELFEMIKECGLSEDLKSYLCYIGLKAQNISEPDMPK